MSTFKKRIGLSNFWVKNGLAILLISLVANHLTEPENFPFHRNYRFPLVPIVVSIFSGGVILLIASLNFNHFKNKYFSSKINTRLLLRFLFSTLGYIAILYSILYFGLNGLIHGIASYNGYYFLNGLAISLLLCTLGIALLFATDIYHLHKGISKEGTLKVQQGGKITLVKYPEIAFLYSENKIVYLVKTDGTPVITHFTLNEVEPKISAQGFFRANRQTILHARSVAQITSIENGKLSVLLKPKVGDQKDFQIVISRYKKQDFMEWFENKI